MNNSILFCERHMFVSMSRLFVLIYICILDQDVCGQAVLQMYVQPAYLAPADREGQPATSANDKQSLSLKARFNFTLQLDKFEINLQ